MVKMQGRVKPALEKAYGRLKGQPVAQNHRQKASNVNYNAKVPRHLLEFLISSTLDTYIGIYHPIACQDSV